MVPRQISDISRPKIREQADLSIQNPKQRGFEYHDPVSGGNPPFAASKSLGKPGSRKTGDRRDVHIFDYEAMTSQRDLRCR